MEPRLLLSADPVSGLDDFTATHRTEPWSDREIRDAPALVSRQFSSAEDSGRVLAEPDPDLAAHPNPYSTELPEALDLADLGIRPANGDPGHSDFDTGNPAISEAARYELVVVDSRVEDYETLVSDLLARRSESREIHVYVLDASRGGVDQMTGILSQFTDLDAVHVISHGNERGFQLGSTWIGANDLDSQASRIETWVNAFSEEADLLLYGCNLAASAEGKALLETFGGLIGVDIAASTDLTGSASLGGDWNLEYSRGSIESAIALDDQLRSQWRGLLATFTVDTTADTVGGPGTSLRDAVTAANLTPGADEIILGQGTYTLDFPIDSDLDITDDLIITGADARTTIIDGDGSDRVLQIHPGANVDVSGVTIRNGGSAVSGAGILVEFGGQLSLSNSVVANNVSAIGSGIRNDGTLTLIDVSVIDNGDAASTVGGGLANYGDATLERVTFSGNRADTGGGIRNNSSATNLSLLNVTLSGNTAATVGGGLFTSELVTITNSTITANSASDGGGIRVSGGQGDVIMSNTIVAGNSGNGPDIQGTISSSGYNIIGDTSGAGGFIGSDKLDTDPDLDPNLAYNGGFTQTHALLTGSLAINGGTNAGAPPTDQRGLARDSSADIGAFEAHAAPELLITTLDDVTASNGVPGMNGTAWQQGDVLTMTDPNLSFGDASTNGTFSVAFDVELFSPGAEINGIHYVSRALTLGSTYTYDLQPGDLLLTTAGGGTTTFVSNGAVPEANLPVTHDDVFLFHPESPGDYSKGNFFMLLEDPLGAEIRGISLIEQDTWVGDMWLRAGDFLFSRSGAGDEKNVKLFETIDVEDSSVTRTTNGTVSDLLLGGDPNVAIDEQIYGLELLENTLIIGDTTLNAGTILVKLENGESLGENNISVNKHDVVSLVVNQTTLGSGVGDVTVGKFFDANGVNFDTNEELINGLTLTSTTAPVVNASPNGFDDAYNVDEDTLLDSNDEWYDTDWSFRRTLSFDNASRGQNLDDFPVLVALDSTRIDYAQTKNNGEDLRFLDGDGTLLAHEIEEWNESGTSYVWVKVPQIDASSAKDFIWMYYGNAVASDGQNASAVWSNDFQAVYHFDQDPGPTGTLSDSTGAFDGTNAGSTDAAARIGRGQTFDGSSDYVDMGSNQPFLNNASGATVSGWIQVDDTTDGNILGVSIAGGPTNNSRATLNINSDQLELAAISDDIEGFRAAYSATGIINTGTWYQVTGVADYASGDLTVYVDGVERASNSVTFNSSATPGTNSWRGIIGANEDGGNRFFDGTMDEVRLADTVRSSDWVSAQYASTSDTFITYGFQQTVAGVLGNDIDEEGDPLTATLVTGPTNAAAFSLNSNGSFTYTPAANFNGTDTFQYRANDGTSDSGLVTVTITVNPVNDVPVAAADSDTTTEDNPVTTGNVLTNDTLGDEPTTITAFDAASVNGGTVVNNGDGTFTYTPAANFNGSDSFTYTITDTDNETSVGTVTVTVTAVNDVPVASGDSDSTAEDTPLVTVDVLANDTLGDAPTAVTAFDTVSTNGATVAYNGNGTFTYIPVANFNGADSFTYTIRDQDGETSVATVSITVTAVNDVPVAVDDSSGTVEDTAVTTANVLGNDTLGDEPTTISAFDAASANGGVVVNNGNGTFTYTPATNFNGSDSFTYTIRDTDGETSTATVTVTVSAVNDVPIAVNDSASAAEDTAVTTGSVLSNDTLGDEPTTITAFDAVSVNGGTVVNNGDGTFDYTPAANFNGSDSFTYTITDLDGETSVGTVTVTVTPVNDVPVAAGDSDTTAEDTTLVTLDVLANDTLGDEPTTVTAFDAVSANGATVAYNGNGTFTYVPAANFNGADTFTYSITDLDGETSIATVSITVTAVNDVPVAADDSSGTVEDTAVTTGNVLTNDNLGDQPTSITAFDATSVNGGTVVNNGDGTFTYTPVANFNGSDSFTYTITDSDNETSSATVTITVTPVNDVPVATNDSASTAEDAVVTTGNVLTNDTLGDQPTTITAFDAMSANGGTVVNNADGTFDYTPAANFNGSDSFTYTITDLDGETSVGTVTVTVTPVNDVPLAAGDSDTTAEDTPLVTLDVLANDTLGDEPTTITAFDAASANGGTVVDNGNGTFTYTPPTGFNGVDSFSYTLTDSDGESSTATVTVTVNPVNDVPAARADNYSTDEDAALTTGNVLSNDSLGDTPTAISAFDALSTNGGTVVNNADGTFSYTPATDFNGNDTFTYTIADSDGETSTATVTIAVTPVNDAPLAVADGYVVTAGDVMTISANGVLDNDVDVDADPLTATLVAGPANGSLSLDADGSFVYTPDVGFSGNDSFVYRANDGTSNSTVAVVSLTVEPEDDNPGPSPNPGNDDSNSGSGTVAPVLVAPPSAQPSAPVDPFTALGSDDAEAFNAAAESVEAFNPRDQVRRGPGGGGATDPDPGEDETEASTEETDAPVDPVDEEELPSDPAEEPAPVQASTDRELPERDSDANLADTDRAMSFLRGNNDFTRELDTLRKNVEENLTIDQTVIGSGVVMATSISVGYVVWMTRGGLLLLSLVSSMPAWRLVDPIPVLGRLRDKRDKDEDDAAESLRSLVEGDSAGSTNREDKENGLSAKTSRTPETCEGPDSTTEKQQAKVSGQSTPADDAPEEAR